MGETAVVLVLLLLVVVVSESGALMPAVVAMALDRCRLHGVQVGGDPGGPVPLEVDAAR